MPIWPFQRAREDLDGEILLGQVTQVSRNVAFYGPEKVADTLEGRFEVVTLFASLAFVRMRAEPGAAALTQSFADGVFSQFDAGLREAAVGDLSVPKRMQKLAGSFYGRLQAYETALKAGDVAALGQAIGRNVFGDEGAPFAATLAGITATLAAKQARLPVSTLLTGDGWKA